MSDDQPERDGPDGALAQFNFLVEFGDGRQGGFQEMSGLDAQEQAVDDRVSHNPVFSASKMPGLVPLGHVTLKRGAIGGGEGFGDWHRAVMLGRVARRAIRIRLRDETGRPVMTWTLANARPTKILGGDEAARGCGEVAIETLEIVCEGIAAEG